MISSQSQRGSNSCLHLERVIGGDPQTCGKPTKPPLTCSDTYSPFSVISRRFPPSRGFFADSNPPRSSGSHRSQMDPPNKKPLSEVRVRIVNELDYLPEQEVAVYQQLYVRQRVGQLAGTNSSCSGTELLEPVQISATMMVPVSVPSLVHSSRPNSAPAPKNKRPSASTSPAR